MLNASDAKTLPPVSELCDAARQAGEIALRYFRKDPKTWTKPGDSPVTEADLAIDRMLHTELRRRHPTFGWLSEEIEDDGSRLDGTPTYIVDPIDGTRGFVAGQDDWAVSIALVQDGVPVQAVLFNPVLGELFIAQAGQGAHVESPDGAMEPVKPSQKPDLDDALILFPGRSLPHHRFRKGPRLASLALRLAQVARGQLDGCVASPNAKHWDIAAADLIMREAGLLVRYPDGGTPDYASASISHPALLCGTSSMCDALEDLLKHAFS